MLPTLLLQPPEDQLHNIAETLTYYTCMFLSDRHLASSEFIMGPRFQFKTKMTAVKQKRRTCKSFLIETPISSFATERREVVCASVSFHVINTHEVRVIAGRVQTAQTGCRQPPLCVYFIQTCCILTKTRSNNANIISITYCGFSHRPQLM